MRESLSLPDQGPSGSRRVCANPPLSRSRSWSQVVALITSSHHVIMLHISHFTFHASYLTFHISRFTFHVSRFTFHVSPFTFHVPRIISRASSDAYSNHGPLYGSRRSSRRPDEGTGHAV